MADSIRKTGRRDELDALWAHVASVELLVGFSTYDDPGIANGTTAGNLKTVNSVDYRVAGAEYTKSATDDLWDLSAETDTDASSYRAYWLLLDSSGTASIDAGDDAASEALALKALPAVTETKSIIGVFVADPSCDFDAAGGLAAQGTIYDGIPAGANIGVPGKSYAAPQGISLGAA